MENIEFKIVKHSFKIEMARKTCENIGHIGNIDWKTYEHCFKIRMIKERNFFENIRKYRKTLEILVQDWKTIRNNDLIFGKLCFRYLI